MNMTENDEYMIDDIIGKSDKKKFAVSLYFEKPIPAVEGVNPLTIHRFLITHTCEAINEKEALGDAIWTHNFTPDNGHLRLWQVQQFGSNLVEDQVMDVFRRQGKIRAIKRRRELTGETLMEAKAVLDALQIKYQVDHMGRPVEKTGSI
jgi:hypothetical protein